MKKYNLILVFIIVFSIFSCKESKLYTVENHVDSKGFKYEVVKNDPMGLRIYTLDNGLKVYLSVNKDKPEISTYIPVKAGSSYDPKETTGLAHYLEHMLFKGSNEFGTIDWAKEKPLLDKISNLYDKHAAATTKEDKAAIYHEIDMLSTEAAKYAVPNEYDNLLSSIGAKGTNAYTSNEKTVYINTIPSNELEKWLKIESSRFSKLVLRLFHTELEAVYEEFNMGQDNDMRKMNAAVDAALYQNHPYGTQTTIGLASHLKNPSMKNIHKYFETYYVPNNMAITMSGDLDFDTTIELIDKYFGKFESKEVPVFNSPEAKAITTPLEREVFGPSAEMMMMAYRFKGNKSIDKKYVTLIDALLNNSKAGLIDLNLNQKQKLMRAGSFANFLNNYGAHTFYGMPRDGQSLSEVKDLILGEIEKIKKGDFPDWLLSAVINDFRLTEIKAQESNQRAHNFVDVFTSNISWIDEVNFVNDLEKITKEEIVAFANEHYKNNYVVVYKRKGEDKNVVKVDKPIITPIKIDRSKSSEFAKEVKSTKSPRIEPLFLDFKKEIQFSQLQKGVSYDYMKNTSNELFKLFYIFEMGTSNNKKLAVAVDYLMYLGTDKYTAAELQQEMFKNGLSIGVNVSDEKSYVYVKGIEKSFDKGLELLEHILSSVKADKKAYSDFVDGIIKDRKDSKLNKNYILRGALLNYAMYDGKSPFTDILSEKELRAINPKELVQILTNMNSYKHKIFYYGNAEKSVIAKKLKQMHKVSANLKEVPALTKYNKREIGKDQVFFVNYDMVQANMMIISKDVDFDKNILAKVKYYNEYYAGGMGAIVFQEIRESRALAYSASSYYKNAGKKDEPNYSVSFVGTSADKLENASKAMLDLLNNMPYEKDQVAASKNNLLKKIESERITKDNIYWTYYNNLELGIDYDYRKDVYEQVKLLTNSDLTEFFNKHIANKKHVYLIIGNKKELDMEMVKNLGEFKELSLEEIFNY